MSIPEKYIQHIMSLNMTPEEKTKAITEVVFILEEMRNTMELGIRVVEGTPLQSFVENVVEAMSKDILEIVESRERKQ